MVQEQTDQNIPSPYVITLCQQKGGVGKTTTAVCLGTGLAQTGKQVLLLDLAPSGNLTSAFGINLSRVKRSTTDLFHNTYPPKSLIKPTSVRGLNIIPANASLFPIPRELYQEPDYEFVLKKILVNGDFPDYDIIILDCPPGMDSLIINAIACSDLAILPLVCEYFALQTLENMFQLIKLSHKRANPEMTYRLLITKMDRRATLHKRVYAQIEEHYKAALLNTIIGVDIKLPESQLAGIPILVYDPKSRATKQYRALTNEILGIINNSQRESEPDQKDKS
jgi:chromosome partitioning protein